MTSAPDTEAAGRDARAAIASNPFWYHSIEVAPGVVTPGCFDLRPIADKLPWPDVRGKRCLDVGTSDGFFAFELERRGAAEVVATDLLDHDQWDWPVHLRSLGPEYQRQLAGPTKGAGFEIVRELLRSSARLERLSVYDLSPDAVGQFDVVVCGSLLLHLREPLRALMAIRAVCREHFLSCDQVELRSSALHRKQPLARLDGTGDACQWWLPNTAAHRQMLRAAGFEVERESRLYSIPFGPTHAPRRRTPRRLASMVVRRLLTGGDGVPHHAILARPAGS